MITGLDLGILAEEEFGAAVEKGWNALCGFVNEKGEVEKVCMWTNAKKREWYYLRRPRITGDYHGQAAFLWASAAMIRYKGD
jgi:rhamnogalacturonyl hydrolase YesR